MLQRIRRHPAKLALACALAVACVILAREWTAFARDEWPVVRLWHDRDAQYRNLLLDAPYDLLRAADAVLPREEPVLLVTPGEDVRHRDYTTFHRALYFLAPRAVWWMTPAPPDGTWESRWWIAAPITPATIQALAGARGIRCILVAGLPDGIDAGQVVATWPGGSVVALDPAVACTVAAPEVRAELHGGWPLRVLVAAVFPWLLGLLGLVPARRLGHRPDVLEGAALGWILGSGLLTAGMLWLAGAGLSLTAQRWATAVVAGVGSLVAAMVWIRGRPRGSPLRRSREHRSGFIAKRCVAGAASSAPRTGWRMVAVCLLLAVVLAQTALVAARALGRPLVVWDSWVNWGMKARHIFLEDGLAPEVYAEPSRTVTLQDYPLHVPLLEAWFYGWAGAADDRLAGVPAVLTYVSLLALAYAALRRWGGSRAHSLAGAALAGTLPHLAGLAGLVFPDLTVAVLAVITGIYLVEWLAGHPPGTLWLAALAAGLLPWTKREGLVLVLALAAGALLSAFVQRSLGGGSGQVRRAALATVSIALAATVLAGPWWMFTEAKEIANPNFLPLSLGVVLQNFARLPRIAIAFGSDLLSFSFAWIWPLAACVAVSQIRRRSLACWLAEPRNLLLIGPAVYLPVIALAYLLSDYAPYQQHLANSSWRLVAQVAALPALWLAAAALMPADGRAGDDTAPGAAPR